MPAVLRPPRRGTSDTVESLATCLAGLADPRQTSRCDQRLVDILVIAVCAVVACAESWEDIELYGCGKQALRKERSFSPHYVGSGEIMSHACW